MRKKLLLGTLIVALLLAAIGCTQTQDKQGQSESDQIKPPAATQRDDKGGDETQPGAAGAVIEAEIDDFAFKLAEIRAKVNDKVVWENKDSTAHTVVADDGSFESGSLVEGQQFEKVFGKAGTYDYHCGIHPSMTGKVIVE